MTKFIEIVSAKDLTNALINVDMIEAVFETPYGCTIYTDCVDSVGYEVNEKYSDLVAKLQLLQKEGDSAVIV